MAKTPSDEVWKRDEEEDEKKNDFTPEFPVDLGPDAEEGANQIEKSEELAFDKALTELEDIEIKEEKPPVKEKKFRKFLRKHLFDMACLSIVLLSLIGIIFLSEELVSDPDMVNPDEIIGYESNTHISILILSIIAFWLILIVFSKMVFWNRGHEFGVESWSLFRKIIFFIITLIFVASVYMLFDVAVINSFLLMGSNTIIWSIKNDYVPEWEFLSEIPSGTDRLAYADIRGLLFTLFYITLLIFPVTMFLVIFTRMGRTRLMNPKMGDKKYTLLKKLFKYSNYTLLILGIIGILIIALSLPGQAILFGLFLLVLGFIVLWTIFGLTYVAFKVFDVAKWMLMSNILIIAPLVFVFFIFPVFAWSLWDIFLIFDTGTLDNTIYTLKDISFADTAVPSNYDLREMEFNEQISFFGRTFYWNLFAYQRVLMLDFVIIVGTAAFVIGLAEGYSIVAILKALFKGASIARTGQIAAEAPPRMVVITTRLALFAAWLGLVWDSFLVIWNDLAPRLNISLPEIEAPGLLEVLQELVVRVLDVNVLIPIALLIIPCYFIISSSLKFFSVTLVSERFKHDPNLIFLLTSSAYVLIVTAIFGDIAGMEDFKADHKPYLPLSNTPIITLLPD
ncbi:MAG: hypothetical protein ACFFCQ_08905, partial [Promethearchaeota archaeon]